MKFFTFFKKSSKSKSLKKKRSILNTYIRFFRYANIFDWFGVSIAAVFTILAALCQPYYFHLFGKVIQHLIEDVKHPEQETLGSSWNEIFKEDIRKTCLQILKLGFINLISLYLAGVIFSYCTSRQIFEMRRKMFEKIMKQDVNWYDLHKTGDFAVVLSENFAKVEDGIGEKFIFFLFNQTLFVACTIWSLLIGWKLTLLCLLPLPVLFVVVLVIPKLSRKLSNVASQSCNRAGAIAEETFRIIRTVVAFGGQNKEIQRYKNSLVEAKTANMKICLTSGLKNGMTWFVRFAGTALPWWYGYHLIMKSGHSSSDSNYSPVLVITICTNMSVGSLYFTMGCVYLEIFGIACGAADKIFEILDYNYKPEDTIGKLKLEKIAGSITFDKVRFSYPSRKDVEVLKNLTIKIKPRQRVAFVGTSGSGKSTCIQLLERFYDPSFGTICIDQINLKNFDLSCLRGHIGLISQEATLFANTIAENIRFGNLTATHAEIVKAAKKANVDSFISSLPKGYETVIGERGMQLSGGQKQKIALARALVRNPSILLLDEATSALDCVSEAEVQAALESVIGQYTTIIVAHRLSTIKNVDQIFVFSEGQVVERGTYSELMETKGQFYKLEKLQSHHRALNPEYNRNIRDKYCIDLKEYVEKPKRQKQNVRSRNHSKHIMLEILRICKLEWKWIFFGICASVGIAVGPYFYGLIFANMMWYFSLEDEKLMKESVEFDCIALFFLGLGVGLSYFLQSYSFGVLGENLTLLIRTKMFATIIKQDMEWFDKEENGVGALCARISSDGNAIQEATGLPSGIFISFMFSAVLCAGFSLYYEWKLALLLTTFLLITVTAIFVQERTTKHFATLRREKLLENSKLAMAAINDVRTVKAFGVEDFFLQRYTCQLVPCMSLSRKISLVSSAVLAISGCMDFFTFGTGFFYGMNLILSREADYRDITKVSVLMYSATWCLGNTLSFISNLQNGIRASRSIKSLFLTKPKVNSNCGDFGGIWENGNIEYKNVSFSYPTRPSTSILKGLNLLVQPGRTIALVGATGCGKTSIIQLLQKFYHPTSGMITVDKSDIKQLNLQHHRAKFGVVSQEPNLFDRTIAENIAYGDNSRAVTMEEIIEAAKSANIHNFISSLPRGYETVVGTGGKQISGGQKQRIAIARALVRNPKILILDEATSALDNESESVVQEALDKAKEGRTCITIAHRLSTIYNADFIYVIDKGEVVEVGNHEELMKMCGFYFQLNQF